jgi:Fic family protein
MSKYIWQQPDWPHLTWNADALLAPVSQVRKLQGQLLAHASSMNLETKTQLIVDEAVTTSEIEGEMLDRGSVRSSVARQLGLPSAGLTPQQRHIDGLVEMLLDATQGWDKKLTGNRLKGWQAALFPTGYSGIHKIAVGTWREGHEPMQVVSTKKSKTTIHYEAPPSEALPQEMKNFLKWWNDSQEKVDGLLRAGIAHFYFVTIHPFDDGNGRISRAITDMALAQDEKTGTRFYSLSTQIIKSKDAYYDILESSQKETCDITLWLKWFLNLMSTAILDSQQRIQETLNKAFFWQKHSQKIFNDRQRKALKRLLDAEPHGFEGGMTNKKYVNLTKTSRESAKRDLAELEEMGLLHRNPSGGRSISYSLVKTWTQQEE